MKISLLDAGKRYNREWIFRHFNYQFLPTEHYAITGANGSGKSTLLQVIAGAILQSEGKVVYEPVMSEASSIQPKQNLISDKKKPLPGTEPYTHISIAAPYLELIEEMTALEFLSFHNKFKKLIAGNLIILEETGLLKAANKQIRYYSSGMKQRLKLAQAFFSETSVLFLDEPTTNLDAEGIELYHALISKYASDRLVIVSSNDEQEYSFCRQVIRIGDYKPA